MLNDPVTDPVAAMAGMVAAGVAEMTDAITAVLSEIDVAGQAVVDALADTKNVDAGACTTEGASFAPTNWAAYSHEELYQMLRDQADVSDVSEIAAEWGRHAEALTGYADTVREQHAALTANWQGEAAERAADRINQLAELIGAIGARAGQVQQAAQDAADALALARNTMPVPLGAPALTAPSGGSGTGAAANGTGGGGMVFAVGAVSMGGTSMFNTDFFAGSGRSRAEEVMRGYESSLHGSDARIAPPVRTTAGDADLTESTHPAGFAPGGVGPGAPGGGAGGVPWSQLTQVGVPESGGAQGRGSLPPGTGGLPLRAALHQLSASGRIPGGTGGAGFSPFMPPATGLGGDKEHQRRQPNVTKGLFADDRVASKPIIGE
jgi:hypothetical protein